MVLSIGWKYICGISRILSLFMRVNDKALLTTNVLAPQRQSWYVYSLPYCTNILHSTERHFKYFKVTLATVNCISEEYFFFYPGHWWYLDNLFFFFLSRWYSVSTASRTSVSSVDRMLPVRCPPGPPGAHSCRCSLWRGCTAASRSWRRRTPRRRWTAACCRRRGGRCCPASGPACEAPSAACRQGWWRHLRMRADWVWWHLQTTDHIFFPYFYSTAVF